MSHDVPGAESAGRDREVGRGRHAVPWDRFAIGAVLVVAPAVAATAVAGGASPAAAAVLMVMMMAGGLAGVRFLAPSMRGRPAQAQAAASTAEGHLDQLVDRRPLTPVERQLSSRYGVWVEQVAGHVWLVDGELIEAVLDEGTCRLMIGHHELSLRTHQQP